ncbi:MAG TPA: type IV pilus biogenesis/stability protein PilW [Burkholderiales bacterium]|nr:type IV pilus biogenesis/stability protein PilW [Burkholderiales bacterium]
MSRSWLILAMVVLLGACAQSPKSNETSAQESTALNRARVHTDLATAYYGAGQYEVALEEVRIALDADDKYLPAVNQLGLIHLALGQMDQAQTVLQRAIRLDPDDPSINNNYGMLLCTRGDATEAMRYFEKAIGDPLYRSPEFAYVNAGVCMKREGDFLRAEQFFRRALALSPDQPQALYQMADLQFQNDEFESARGFITRHLQVVVPGPDALWLAARIDSRLGDFVAVESYGAQLNRRFPDFEQTRAFNQGRF